METKNIVLAVAGVLVVAFFIALIAYNLDDSVSETEDSSLMNDLGMHEAYPELPEDNQFIEESGDEIVSRFSSGSGVIFLGFKECPWCQRTAPLINQAAESEDVPIYYLDIRQERENESLAYQEIVRILSPHLPKDEEGGVRISTPDISIVKDGEILWRYELDAVTEAEQTPETYWTEEREERAITQFKEEMNALQ